MSVYPEKDVTLLQAWPDPISPPVMWPADTIPNDQVQPEVDITLLPGVPGQRGPSGPIGPSGPAGPKGDQGPIGLTPAVGFTYTPDDSQQVWYITHNLGFYPSVRVVNIFGTEFIGDVVYTDISSLTITFSGPVYATAYLS